MSGKTNTTFDVKTRARSQFVDISGKVADAAGKLDVTDGAVVVYVPHTTAGITINEGADPSVAEDILTTLDKLVPWRAGYSHTEGNAAAHIKASLVGSSVIVPVRDGKLTLGTWQSIFFCEFDGPRSRRCVITVTDSGS
jgi:secondary thiamine-phosphate synthase enzyme